MNTSVKHSPFQLYFNGVLGFLVRKNNSIKYIKDSSCILMEYFLSKKK